MSASPKPSNKCATCGKSAYEQERMIVDGVVYHKNCLKCEICKKTLGPGNYTALSAHYYCKPCYIKLFKAKGNYDEGFGREQHKKNWAPAVFGVKNDFTKDEPSPTASPKVDAPTSPVPGAPSPDPQRSAIASVSPKPMDSVPSPKPKPAHEHEPAAAVSPKPKPAQEHEPAPKPKPAAPEHEAAASPKPKPAQEHDAAASPKPSPSPARKLPAPVVKKPEEAATATTTPPPPKKEEPATTPPPKKEEQATTPPPKKEEPSSTPPLKKEDAESKDSPQGAKRPLPAPLPKKKPAVPLVDDEKREDAGTPEASERKSFFDEEDDAVTEVISKGRKDKPAEEQAAAEKAPEKAEKPKDIFAETPDEKAEKSAKAKSLFEDDEEPKKAEEPPKHPVVIEPPKPAPVVHKEEHKPAPKEETKAAPKEEPHKEEHKSVPKVETKAAPKEEPHKDEPKALTRKEDSRLSLKEPRSAVAFTREDSKNALCEEELHKHKAVIFTDDDGHAVPADKIDPSTEPDVQLEPRKAFSKCGSFLCSGANQAGQLGLGDTAEHLTPQLNDALDGKSLVRIASWHHSLAVTDSGDLYVWGNNAMWQLGLGDTDHRKSPLALKLNQSSPQQPHVVDVACGAGHSLVATDTGAVYAWGRGASGELGLGDFKPRTCPARLNVFEKVKVSRVYATENHSFALLSSGELYAWGNNFTAQLGVGDYANRANPEEVSSFPPPGRHIVDLGVGLIHTLALLDNGEVYSWGTSRNGELGLGEPQQSCSTPQLIEFFAGKPVRAISCGAHHSIAITQSDEVYVWGLNSNGQLGLGNLTDQCTPQRQEQVEQLAGKIVSISAGANFTAILGQRHELYVWGDSSAGQIGLGPIKGMSQPQRLKVRSQNAPDTVNCGFRHLTIGLTPASDL